MDCPCQACQCFLLGSVDLFQVILQIGEESVHLHVTDGETAVQFHLCILQLLAQVAQFHIGFRAFGQKVAVFLGQQRFRFF